MFPFTGLRLLLPAIVPSWRFFDAVTASPRIDYVLLPSPDVEGEDWREFRPRAAVLTPGRMMRRLVWNPEWNENLYLVSLAERLMSRTTAATEVHSERELLLRVARHLDRHGLGQGVGQGGAWLRIRLRFVSRTAEDDRVAARIVYVSAPHAMAGLVGA